MNVTVHIGQVVVRGAPAVDRAVLAEAVRSALAGYPTAERRTSDSAVDTVALGRRIGSAIARSVQR